ncbi:hypothetical protein ACTMTJ_18865 [Phytohabitans sp. LJ34]|uniref:hypothetical protein n=1 Tax=Phytohabitans sp. LJ34 TaxID=3452217 RepID=UPI003F88D525
MRARIATLGVLLVAAVLAPAPPASAAPSSPQATVVCDTATNTITARISGGGFTGGSLPVTVHFDVIAGSYVTATAQGTIPQVGTRVTKQAATSDNTIDVVGYQRAWPSAGYRFYTETVRVTVVNDNTGGTIAQRDGYCAYDTRTTYTFTCDQATRTIRLDVAGRGYPPNLAIRVVYTHRYVYQIRPDEPGFGTIFPDRYQPVRVGPDGTWTQVGFEGVAGETPPVYLYHHFTIRVEEVRNGWPLVVGRGEATCLYSDNRR